MRQATFRVDASQTIGTGHVVRCLTLAGVLRDRNVSVSFVCREHPGNLCGLIESRGFPVTRLPQSGSQELADLAPAHASWLGSDWQTDAEQTRSAIEARGRTDWLIVDNYALDWRWEKAVSVVAGEIVVIDDLADRRHCSRLLVDQNLVGQMAERHLDKVPPECALLLGPSYALLQPSYARLHALVTPRRGPIKRILVSFGGSDPHNLTGRALAAFLRLDRPEVEVDAVVPDDSPHAASLDRQIAGIPNVRMHHGLPTLSGIMARADLAVGAGGATNWERLCLGLPSLVVTTAENQRSIAEELGRRSLIRYLGHHDTVGVTMIEDALAGALGNGSDEQWSRRCLAVVDGAGAARVASVMLADSATQLRLRPANEADEAQLLEWANDRLTRQNAFSPERIPTETHRAWFLARVNDPDNCIMYVAETLEGEPVGTVRFQRSVEGWEVHFSLAPSFRGRGLGRRLLQDAIAKLGADTIRADSIFGQVREGNLASRRIFEALYFEGPTQAKEGVFLYRRLL